MKLPSTVLIFAFFCFVCLLNIVSSQRTFEPNDAASGANVDAFWLNVTGAFEGYIAEQSLAVNREWNRAVVRGGLKRTVSPKCLSIIEKIIRRPLESRWSAQIIDSMKLSPPGILSGTTTELGDFDQCLAVDGHFGGDHFVGKYCLATINLPRAELFRPSGLNGSLLKHEWLAERIEKWYQNDNYYAVATGVCFPSLCQPEEIKEMLTAYYPILNSFDFNVTYCQARDEPRQYDDRIWIALTILALPWLLIIPGTLFELLSTPQSSARSSILSQILLSFSLLSNSRILFRMVDSNSVSGSNSQAPSPVNAQFQFVHGIRALASLFIVTAHTSGLVNVLYQMRVAVVARHPTEFVENSKLAIAQPFYNGALVVLTFFLISGMFLSFWSASAKRLRMNFAQYVILRWLRYTPPLIGMLCLVVCLEFLGSGPLFHHDHLWTTLKPCYEDWLAHLLFFSNYRDIDKTCGIHTWYISVEMQLHLLAFIFLVAYVRSRKLAAYIALFFILSAMFLIVLFVGLGWSSIPLVHVVVHTQFPITNAACRYIFFAPTMNAVPYFLGVLIGQALLENRVIRLSRTATRTIWALALLILAAVPMASLPQANDPAMEPLIPGNTSVGNAALFAVMVFLWSLANGWVVYQCVINHRRGALARFLSAKIWQPLSRLSFCFYLVHLSTIWFNVNQTRIAVNIAALNEIYKFISLAIVQSLGLAYLLYVSFEAPSVNLLKLLMMKKPKVVVSKVLTAEKVQAARACSKGDVIDSNNNIRSNLEDENVDLKKSSKNE